MGCGAGSRSQGMARCCPLRPPQEGLVGRMPTYRRGARLPHTPTYRVAERAPLLRGGSLEAVQVLPGRNLWREGRGAGREGASRCRLWAWQARHGGPGSERQCPLPARGLQAEPAPLPWGCCPDSQHSSPSRGDKGPPGLPHWSHPPSPVVSKPVPPLPRGPPPVAWAPLQSLGDASFCKALSTPAAFLGGALWGHDPPP